MRMRDAVSGLLWVAALAAAGCAGGSPGSPTPVAAPTPVPTPAATARYSVTFDATWSAATHPVEIPPDPHFSRLIGGTHGGAVTFWAPGQIATEGIEAMAERGNPDLLAREVEEAVTRGTAQHVLRGGALPLSPGSVSLEFEIGRDHPLVTLVTMLAPSPDWFVGVHGLSLIDGGDWARERVVTLFAYDAGTDGGETYLSPDRDTQPRQPIARIEGRPLAFNGAVAPAGTFTFRRLP